MIDRYTLEDMRHLEYAHLNLDLDNIDFKSLRNPFKDYHTAEDYEMVLRAMRDPKNFFFTCKYILGVEPTIFQLVWLDVLWRYPFPMLIANRGASKTFLIAVYYLLRALITQGCKIVVASATFRQSKFIFEYMETIWYNAPVLRDLCGENGGPSRGTDVWTFKIGDSTIKCIPLGTGEKIRGLRANYVDIEEFDCLDGNTLVETSYGLQRIVDSFNNRGFDLINKNGLYETPNRFITTPMTEVYEVKTERGYSFKCSNKHKVFTTKGVKLAKDLIPGDCIISKNKYKFPEVLVKSESLTMDENLAWMFGILISEGYVNRKHRFGILMTDEDCVERFRKSVLTINPTQHTFIQTKEPYQDKRFKGLCKKSYKLDINNTLLIDRLEELGLDRVKVHDKKIPWSILQSPRNIVLKFIAGLFEGDGSSFLWGDKFVENRLGVSYYTVSKQLAQEVQVVLKKLGYLSNLVERTNHLSKNIQYMLRLNGLYAYQLARELNIKKWETNLENCYEKYLEDKPTINYAKSENSFLVYSRVDGKNKRVGKFKSYEEAFKRYKENQTEHLVVKSVNLLPDKDILYDFTLPETHSFYGNGILQHNSVPEEIFEVVIRGFTSTSSNPVQAIKSKAKIQKMKDRGLWNDETAKQMLDGQKPNQIILSGTAGYDFSHFAKYWKRYHSIIMSKGNPDKLRECLGSDPEKGFDYKDYAIIKIPYQLLPEGMMDEKAIANAKGTMDEGRFQMEFETIFAKDSNGFFRASLIETCVTKKPINLPSGPVQFEPRLTGDPYLKYIMGVDPASESDNFCIYILEVHSDHVRAVYCWTTYREKFKDKLKQKQTDDTNFYAYVARKIRNLMKVFPIEYICIDSQGGGIQTMEALHDVKSLEAGEMPLWPLRADDKYLWPGSKVYEYDAEPGPHMIEMVSMSKADYVVEANHGMRKDLENKMLLFPHIDSLSLTFANEKDKANELSYDTLQDVILEIEASKSELSTIQHKTTLHGRDNWSAPDTIESGRKGKMRKDRYSALLIANALARRMHKVTYIKYETPSGGFTHQFSQTNHSGKMYYGSSEYVDEMNKCTMMGGFINRDAAPRR